MLFDILFSDGDLLPSILAFLFTAPIFLMSLVFHEVAHGYVAFKLGDPTAKMRGRLTLNPLKHIDPLGAVMMLLCGYGWAKAVPVNPNYFKNPKKGMALVALAGPSTNLILAFLSLMSYAILMRFVPITNIFIYAVALFFYFSATLNVTYAVFNMIPIPPFDGSRVLFAFLPDKYYFGVMRYERVIMLIVLVGMASGVLFTPVQALTDLLLTGMVKLVNLIF